MSGYWQFGALALGAAGLLVTVEGTLKHPSDAVALSGFVIGVLAFAIDQAMTRINETRG